MSMYVVTVSDVLCNSKKGKKLFVPRVALASDAGTSRRNK
jgi:hypothetical protein